MEKDIKRTGYTLKQVEGIAQDRGESKTLCSGRTPGSKELKGHPGNIRVWYRYGVEFVNFSRHF